MIWEANYVVKNQTPKLKMGLRAEKLEGAGSKKYMNVASLLTSGYLAQQVVILLYPSTWSSVEVDRLISRFT